MRRDSISKAARTAIRERSDGRCEALRRHKGGIYARCGTTPVEVHHLLTRARGGDILDRVGETYHLIALCPGCHRASDGAQAYAGGLLIEGYVIWNGDRSWPVYIGPDLYLRNRYTDKEGEEQQ